MQFKKVEKILTAEIEKGNSFSLKEIYEKSGAFEEKSNFKTRLFR